MLTENCVGRSQLLEQFEDEDEEASEDEDDMDEDFGHDEEVIGKSS
jgi:hypothetical protein